MRDLSMSMFASKADYEAAKAANRPAMEADLRQRLNNGEEGDDIPCVMEEFFGCDYEAACDAVFSGDKAAAIKLLDEAISRQAAASVSGTLNS